MSSTQNNNSHLLQDIREDLNHLYKTVYQGNGAPSLVTQVAKLESRLSTLETKLDTNFKTIDTEISLKFKNVTDVVNEKFSHLSYQIASEFEKRKSDNNGRWGFKTGVFTATMAGTCSIIAIIIAEFVKRM